MTEMSSGSSISGRPAINRSITAMCQAKGRNTIRGRGPYSCLPHLTSLDTIHRHPPGNSPLLSGVHPAIICIIQKRPVRQGETDFHCRKRHTSGNASTIPYELRRDSNVSVCPAACYILDSIYWLQQGNNFLECVYNTTKAHCRAFRQGRTIHASRSDMTRGRIEPFLQRVIRNASTIYTLYPMQHSAGDGTGIAA